MSVHSMDCSCQFLEDPRLTRLKKFINDEERYLESLRVAVEIYGEVLRYDIVPAFITENLETTIVWSFYSQQKCW